MIAICLHWAGQSVDTNEPAVGACLATQTHYLDVTGEVRVIEAVHEYNDRAHDAGVMLMPAVGFDVVSSNCLAVRLQEYLPDATKLTLACIAGSNFSPGTARFGVHVLASGIYLREDGELMTVPFGSRTNNVARALPSAPLVAWISQPGAFDHLRDDCRVPHFTLADSPSNGRATDPGPLVPPTRSTTESTGAYSLWTCHYCSHGNVRSHAALAR